MSTVIRLSLHAVTCCILSACSSTHVSTNRSSSQLVIRGVVTEIFPMGVAETTSGWGVTVRVEKVESGEYAQPEFRFAVHSPSMSGLLVGEHYMIIATALKSGYIVDDSQWVNRGEAKW